MPSKVVTVAVNQSAGFRTDAEAGKHRVVIDQPVAAGGSDDGPTPLDYQLIALGGCIAAVARIIAMQRRWNLRGVRVEVQGTINTDGVLGKPSSDPVGFSAISAAVSFDTDLSRPEQEKLLEEIERRCPISDSLTRPTPVRVALAS